MNNMKININKLKRNRVDLDKLKIQIYDPPKSCLTAVL